MTPSSEKAVEKQVHKLQTYLDHFQIGVNY